MIGPNLRKAFRVLAWVYMVGGVFAALMIHLGDFTLGAVPSNAIPAALYGLLGPVVQGVFVLALLSIDERLERKA